jgi:hypothetical protein
MFMRFRYTSPFTATHWRLRSRLHPPASATLAAVRSGGNGTRRRSFESRCRTNAMPEVQERHEGDSDSQTCVLRARLLQDGQVGICVIP